MSDSKRPKVAVLGFYPAQFRELEKKVPHLELVHSRLKHGREAWVPDNADAVLLMETLVAPRAKRVVSCECRLPLLRVRGGLSAARKALLGRFPSPGQSLNFKSAPPVPLPDLGGAIRTYLGVGRDGFEKLFAPPRAEVAAAPPETPTPPTQETEAVKQGTTNGHAPQTQPQAQAMPASRRKDPRRLSQTQFFRLTEELRNRQSLLEKARPSYAQACQELGKALGFEVCEKTLRKAMKLTGVSWELPPQVRAGAAQASVRLRRQVQANSEAILFLFREMGLPVPDALAEALGTRAAADAVAEVK